MVTPLVMLEVEHILTRNKSRAAAYKVNDWLLAQVGVGRVVIPQLDPKMLARARLVQTNYLDLKLDLTDAFNVVVANEYATNVILSFDRRDFRAIKPLSHHANFRLLPDDL